MWALTLWQHGAYMQTSPWPAAIYLQRNATARARRRRVGNAAAACNNIAAYAITTHAFDLRHQRNDSAQATAGQAWGAQAAATEAQAK